MKKFLFSLILFGLSFTSCQKVNKTESILKYKQEILEIELNFAKLAREEGLYKAFNYYAADDAVILRQDSLIKGKINIDLFYQNKHSKGLDWKPDFVDVDTAGELGYTYGHYVFTYKDSIGNSIENKGIFHTIWKRQANGTWRFVWD